MKDTRKLQDYEVIENYKDKISLPKLQSLFIKSKNHEIFYFKELKLLRKIEFA